MDLTINVTTQDACNVVILDTTSDASKGYLPEGSTVSATNRFRYSDTVSIDVLQHNKSSKVALETPIYTVRTSTISSVTLPVSYDGWFSVYHIVIPSSSWFSAELAKENRGSLPLYTAVYYSNGATIYKYSGGVSTEATVQELIEMNLKSKEIVTTISRIYKEYVAICFLQNCYVSLCQQIMNGKGFTKCWNKSTVDQDLIYKRDLIQMAINVIKYMTQFNQLTEAERIIERIGGCNGLCKSQYSQSTDSGCGCSK